MTNDFETGFVFLVLVYSNLYVVNRLQRPPLILYVLKKQRYTH